MRTWGELRAPRACGRPVFRRDLARAEWAVSEVFDALRCLPPTETDLVDTVAPGDWARARLVPVSVLRP